MKSNTNSSKFKKEDGLETPVTGNSYLRYYEIKENTIEWRTDKNQQFFNNEYKEIEQYDIFEEDINELNNIWTPKRKNGSFIDVFKFTSTQFSLKDKNIESTAEIFETNCAYMELTSVTDEQKQYWSSIKKLKDEFFSEENFKIYATVYFYLMNSRGLIPVPAQQKSSDDTFHNIKNNFYWYLQSSKTLDYSNEVSPILDDNELLLNLKTKYVEVYEQKNNKKIISDLYEYSKYKLAIQLIELINNKNKSYPEKPKNSISLSTYNNILFEKVHKERESIIKELKSMRFFKFFLWFINISLVASFGILLYYIIYFFCVMNSLYGYHKVYLVISLILLFCFIVGIIISLFLYSDFIAKRYYIKNEFSKDKNNKFYRLKYKNTIMDKYINFIFKTIPFVLRFFINRRLKYWYRIQKPKEIKNDSFIW